MPGLGKNPGNSKNPWEWEKLVFTGKNEKNGKNCLFLNTCLKSMLNHWQINDGMF